MPRWCETIVRTSQEHRQKCIGTTPSALTHLRYRARRQGRSTRGIGCRLGVEARACAGSLSASMLQLRGGEPGSRDQRKFGLRG